MLLLWPREREPEYNGVTLSAWLQHYKARNDTLETFAAIRHIGTNGFPFLLRWIQYERPGWRKFLYSAVSKLPRPLSGSRMVKWLLRDKAEERANSAVDGFEILGLGADPVRSELQRLAANSSARETQNRAIQCLIIMAHIPPGDFDRSPILIR
jgi:hypothetical protein